LLVLVLQVRVVILGQDPYINAGEAMGLSFSVPPGMCVCVRAVHLQYAMHQQTCITAAPSAAQAAGNIMHRLCTCEQHWAATTH